MGLFSRKQTVLLDIFCREFYDKNILNPVIEGMDVGAAYFQTVKRSIVEVDTRFSGVDAERLLFEMTLIRFELFGLAWLHQLGDKHVSARFLYPHACQ